MADFDFDAIYDNLVKAEPATRDPVAAIDRLLFSGNVHDAMYAMTLPELQSRHVITALKHKDPRVAAMAARHQLLTPDLFGTVLSHPNPQVRSQLLQNPNATSDLADEYFRRFIGENPKAPDSQDFNALLQNPRTKVDHLIQMMVHPHAPHYASTQAISHPNFHTDALNQFVEGLLERIRQATPPTGEIGENLNAGEVFRISTALEHAAESKVATPEMLSAIAGVGSIKGTYDAHLQGVVRNQKTPSSTLGQLLDHPNLVGTIIRHDNFQPEHITKILSSNPSAYNVDSIISSNKFDPNVHGTLLMQSPSHHMSNYRAQLLRRKASPELIKLWMEKHPDPMPEETRAALTNPNSPPELALRHIDDYAGDVRELARKHPSLTPEWLDATVRNPTTLNETRIHLLGHPNLPPETTAWALTHPDPFVRRSVIKNKNLTPEHRNMLLQDSDPDVRAETMVHLLASSKLSPQHIQTVWNNWRNYPPSLLHQMMGGGDITPEHKWMFLEHPELVSAPGTRRYSILARTAASMPNIPEDLAYRLMDDPETDWGIRGTLLRNPHLKLLPRHIDAMIESENEETALRAAQHPDVTKEQLNTILTHPHWIGKGPAKEAYDQLFAVDPDSAGEPVQVRHGTGKMRKARDYILANSNDKGELPPRKVLPNGDWLAAGRLPNGNISAKLLDAAINAVPVQRYNVTHGTWAGSQRHSDETQKAFQLNLSSDQVKKLKSARLWNYYQRLMGQYSSHPQQKSSIGWVRYTGTPQTGIFIDEVQSDIANGPFDRKMRNIKLEYKQRLERNTATTGKAEPTPEDKQWLEEKTARIIKEVSRNYGVSNAQDAHNKMLQIMCGDKHPHVVLHEGFQQYLRDKGHIGARVAIHSGKTKTHFSGWNTDEPIPVHAKIAYEDHPKKMGFEPGTYDSTNMPTMTGTQDELKGGPIWQDSVRKYEKLSAAIKKLIEAKVLDAGQD